MDDKKYFVLVNQIVPNGDGGTTESSEFCEFQSADEAMDFADKEWNHRWDREEEPDSTILLETVTVDVLVIEGRVVSNRSVME